MRVPAWLSIAVATVVALFGLYRMRLAFRSAEAEKAARERGGLYGYPRRTHLLFGIVYLLLAGWLVAGVLGYRVTP